MQQTIKSFLLAAGGSLVTLLLVPGLLLVFSNYFIPKMLEESNRRETARATRLKKAYDIGERNNEFNSRLNALKTRMDLFNSQNTRGRLSAAQVREAQRTFQAQHTADYLDLDRMAWWWYWDFKRDAQIFDLLSKEELDVLHNLITKYGENTGQSVGAISPTWEHLSSANYRLDTTSQKHLEGHYKEMITKMDTLAKERSELVNSMAKIFAQTQHMPFESGSQ